MWVDYSNWSYLNVDRFQHKGYINNTWVGGGSLPYKYCINMDLDTIVHIKNTILWHITLDERFCELLDMLINSGLTGLLSTLFLILKASGLNRKCLDKQTYLVLFIFSAAYFQSSHANLWPRVGGIKANIVSLPVKLPSVWRFPLLNHNVSGITLRARDNFNPKAPRTRISKF